MKFTGFNFNVSAVAAGQKANTVNANPTLTANSTSGKFMITGKVSARMGIAPGENIMFYNTENELRTAIQLRSQVVLDYCAENDIDIDSAEGEKFLLENCVEWFIAKGYPLFDSKGAPEMSTVRMTFADKAEMLADEQWKKNFIESNIEVLSAKYASEEGQILTYDELKDVVKPEDIESPSVQAFSGSKTATTSSATSTGLPLNFTDTTIWHKLKADLGDDKEKKNRVFDVDLDSPRVIEDKNGFETISVTIYPIHFKEDTDPIVRNTNK